MERKALSQFHAILRERHYHYFDPVSKTQPGLALSPKELLARVGKGLVSPIDIKDALSRPDSEPDDEYPSDDEYDLASAYERNEQRKKELAQRIAEIKAEKAKKAAEEKAELDRINNERKLKKQAEALARFANVTSTAPDDAPAEK